ncbi:LOW QUALITY PROTEIN: membrane-associated transporter protein-like [Homarus americanus]|uniref:LOW QUALITY PROTEIN: membrane-associated transporter protein-like n=1 Tax=Homarus americanus TaxID=6706 RepID=UPI001C46E84F|nr:LOW QUALITY PROTEIN: membrane-associated transporter protein-like [Homarus americanus]
MEDKLASYTGGLHIFKSYLKEKWGTLKEQGASGTIHELKEKTGTKVDNFREKAIHNLNHGECDDYSHIYRRKSRMEMVRISAAVMGIEFCYAAETAFVSPTLLKIGVRHRHMTLIWCLSPFIGFFLTPILGSLSDNCRSKLGRRRPFIILLSIGIILGLILVPNGKAIGLGMGDDWSSTPAPSTTTTTTTTGLSTEEVSELMTATEPGFLNASTITDVISHMEHPENVSISDAGEVRETRSGYKSHPWGIFFTIVGTMLLDFDADACQSPSRAYLLDVTIPGLLKAGLGGGFGYAMGGINWDATFIGVLMGGHVRAVFTIVTFIFIACVLSTLYSFREVPLEVLQKTTKAQLQKGMSTEQQVLDPQSLEEGKVGYGTMGTNTPLRPSSLPLMNGHGVEPGAEAQGDVDQSYSEKPVGPPTSGDLLQPAGPDRVEGTYGRGSRRRRRRSSSTRGNTSTVSLSIVYMPRSLRILCLTNLFCWMSLVCYSLYFTDFVGEAVFGGDPGAPDGTREKELYEEGVRFGCWGMALYSLSCSVYSFLIEKLVKKFGAKPVYVCGQLVYSVGMVFMAALRHPAAVIIFSCCAGVMYSTLFTMPYLLVAHYHASETIKCEDVWLVTKIRHLWSRCCGSSYKTEAGEGPAVLANDGPEQQVRGLGTDVAIISSMVFLAQFILSSCMGSIIAAVGSTTTVVCAASVLALFGSITATQVVYLDL